MGGRLLIGLAAIYLLCGLGTRPLERYDEARRGVNATEMAAGYAHPLVPTYAGRPDRWGTKPPLLVWCQALAIRVLGRGEVAVRLPSVLATLALGALLLWWSRRDWGGAAAGAVAFLFTLASANFTGNHGARSGDYDALLLLFLVAQVVYLYRYTATGHRGYLVAFAAAIALAGWTKGIAGGFFLPSIGLWLLVARRDVLRRPVIYLAGLAGLLLAAAYYPLREAVDPGFLAAVWENELGGRFARENEGHGGPWFFYLRELVTDAGNGWLVVPTVAAAALVPLLRQRNSERPHPFGLVAACLFTFLTVISLAATKLYWYATPALPLLGLLLGLVLTGVAGNGSGRRRLLLPVLAALLLLPGLVGNWQRMRHGTPTRNFAPASAPYTVLLRDTAFQPPYMLLTAGYAPRARFYLGGREGVCLAYSERPDPIVVNDTIAPASFRRNDLVVVCTTADWNYLHDRYVTFDRYAAEGCKLVYVHRPRLEN